MFTCGLLVDYTLFTNCLHIKNHPVINAQTTRNQHVIAVQTLHKQLTEAFLTHENLCVFELPSVPYLTAALAPHVFCSVSRMTNAALKSK